LLETIPEIIAKKIYYRGASITPRDIFDIAAAGEQHEASLIAELDRQSKPKGRIGRPQARESWPTRRLAVLAGVAEEGFDAVFTAADQSVDELANAAPDVIYRYRGQFHHRDFRHKSHGGYSGDQFRRRGYHGRFDHVGVCADLPAVGPHHHRVAGEHLCLKRKLDLFRHAEQYSLDREAPRLDEHQRHVGLDADDRLLQRLRKAIKGWVLGHKLLFYQQFFRAAMPNNN